MTDTPDLNELIRELNEDPLQIPGEARPESADSTRLDAWLKELVQRAGSDLLLVAGAPPSVRIDGRIGPLSEGPLSGEEIEEAVVPVFNDGKICLGWVLATRSLLFGPRNFRGRLLDTRCEM